MAIFMGIWFEEGSNNRVEEEEWLKQFALGSYIHLRNPIPGV